MSEQTTNPYITNFSLIGRLVKDPSPYGKKVTFRIAYQPNKKYDTIFIDAFVNSPELCDFVVENYHKGDMIGIVRGTPSQSKDKNGKTYFSIIAWELADPIDLEMHLFGSKNGGKPVAPASPDDDSIPF